MLIDDIEESINFNIDDCEILGNFKNKLYIKSYNCILIISKKEYLRVLNLWLDGKKQYCELYNEFCGVMGYILAIEYQKLKDTKLNEYVDDTIKEILYPTYLVKKFDNVCDFEHG